ncbi:MAG: HAD family hydrolase [Chloroflexi bacterium]|nr:HAD family hydrolase [Chloroflexota bacterium]
MTEIPEPARPLLSLPKRHGFFVGIDSDGCAFDTMEIKHKECFTPNIIKHWDLQAVSKYARQACEFVNLYSQWRGINRWPALVMVFDLLRERSEVQRRGVAVPEAPRIREFIASKGAKSNETLARLVRESGEPELAKALEWSEAVNATIADMVHGVPPFPYVRESLALLAQHAEVIVVSQTPVEALVREWQEHNIDQYVQAIAGQEMGTKSDHIRYAAEGKYPNANRLMIGDAPGDMKAARDNHALFFPINPGHEEESWERFYKEGFARFVEGTYAGEYENELVVEFQQALPSVPPWKKG